MYNKTIVEFYFCDIQNYQGLGKCYQLQLLALADNTYLALDNSGYHEKSQSHPIITFIIVTANLP